MKLTAKLALQQLVKSKKRTAWTLLSIVLSVGMLVSIGGFGTSVANTLDAITTDFDGWTGDGVGFISYALTIFLGVVVSFAAVVVISNAFRVSAGERTKQFGILKSVGATKKQIKSTVLYEGLFLAFVGLPLGLFAGFGLHLLALAIMNGMVDLSAIDGFSTFTFDFEPMILLFSLALSFCVILFSAWFPARKASKIPAINAIKGIGEVKRRKEKAKKARIVGRVFGFEGELAAKQLKRSRRNFRATVVSITVSIVLVMISVSLRTHMNESVGGRIEQLNAPNAGFLLTAASEEFITGMDAETVTNITRGFRNYPDTAVDTMGVSYYSTDRKQFDTMLMVLDADTYTELASIAGVSAGSNILMNVWLEVISDGGFFQNNPYENRVGETMELYAMTSSGEQRAFSETPTHITIHGEVTRLPEHLLYLAETSQIIIVPDGNISAFIWNVKTSDTEGFTEYGTAVFHSYYTLRGGEEFTQMDWTAAILLLTSIVDTACSFIGIFSVMLALLGLTNVISAIVTNIQMREKEFAILTSVGMDKKGLRRMLSLESLLSAARALMFGLPFGFVMAYVIYLGVEPSNQVSISFTAPWSEMLICAVCVFVITFIITHFSAVSLKKGNIIETIRGVE